MATDRLKAARERSRIRKELLKHTLGVDDLGEALGSTKSAGATSKIPPTTSAVTPSSAVTEFSPNVRTLSSSDREGEEIGGGAKRKRSSTSEATTAEAAGGETADEFRDFRDSTAFLKGTQSQNPHNDYSQNFVDTGQRPQNFIRDVGLADRFEEYPKLRELIKLKNDLISDTSHPPMYLKCDLENFDLKSLKPHQFDVILIEPPLEEYARTCGVTNVTKFWDWHKIMALDIAELAAQRSFVFLWCGSSDGLDLGRLCLQSWGFRRCEDICWIKTNHRANEAKSLAHHLEPNAVLQRTKEHCLMGIKGTVRRSTDGDFIHANVDIDLIIDEEAEVGSLDKPLEMFHIIEHFCLGKRRLQIFGRDSTVRPGWLSIGPDLTMSNYDKSVYSSFFNDGQMTTGCSERIESLRPKSPPPKAGGRGRGRGGRGRGGPGGRGGGGPNSGRM